MSSKEVKKSLTLDLTDESKLKRYSRLFTNSHLILNSCSNAEGYSATGLAKNMFEMVKKSLTPRHLSAMKTPGNMLGMFNQAGVFLGMTNVLKAGSDVVEK